MVARRAHACTSLAEDTGQRGLFALDVATGSVTPLVAEGHVSQASAVGDAVFYSHDSLAGPADLHVLSGGRHRRLTRLNAAPAARRRHSARPSSSRSPAGTARPSTATW